MSGTETWALDLDGVVWLAGHPIAGAPEAIVRLRERGRRVVFMTNNSSPTVAQHVATLRAVGIDAEADDVLTSAQAAAVMVQPGERVHVLGGPGVVEAVEGRGCRVQMTGPVDAVVVGIDKAFTYATLGAAASAVRAGARFVGTNDDPTYPTPEGLLPGAGTMAAAVATASGVAPTFAGKPFAPMAALAAERVGRIDVMVGDRSTTDGLMAVELGARFALVLSGVTDARLAATLDPAPHLVSADLAAAVDALTA